MQHLSLAFLATPIAAALVLASAGAAAQPPVQATQAWVRATVAGQTATGLFVDLKAVNPVRLVGGSSPAAQSVEVHEMSMQDGVMRMRAVPALDLPAGQVVSLKPGGLHLMLLGLKQPLKVGEQVRVNLQLQHPDGRTETLPLQAPARAIAATH